MCNINNLFIDELFFKFCDKITWWCHVYVTYVDENCLTILSNFQQFRCLLQSLKLINSFYFITIFDDILTNISTTTKLKKRNFDCIIWREFFHLCFALLNLQSRAKKKSIKIIKSKLQTLKNIFRIKRNVIMNLRCVYCKKIVKSSSDFIKHQKTCFVKNEKNVFTMLFDKRTTTNEWWRNSSTFRTIKIEHDVDNEYNESRYDKNQFEFSKNWNDSRDVFCDEEYVNFDFSLRNDDNIEEHIAKFLMKNEVSLSLTEEIMRQHALQFQYENNRQHEKNHQQKEKNHQQYEKNHLFEEIFIIDELSDRRFKIDFLSNISSLMNRTYENVTKKKQMNLYQTLTNKKEFCFSLILSTLNIMKIFVVNNNVSRKWIKTSRILIFWMIVTFFFTMKRIMTWLFDFIKTNVTRKIWIVFFEIRN